MVKIIIKKPLISIVMFILLINIAYAVGSKLIFDDVDVKVGGKTDRNLVNGDRIGEEAQPGDTVEFLVKLKNNFTSAENLKMRSITAKTTIEGIDDGEDLEEESNEFDLSPGSDKRVTLKFEVPIEVDEDTFDVLIHAEGEDKNGTNHESEMRLSLEVNKKTHMLKITKKSLSPAEVSCNRKNVQLATTAINIGSEDEEDITFQILNSDLGINLKDTIAELRAEPNEPESRFSKTYTFSVPNNAEAGSYPISLIASYNNDRKRAEDTVTLTVNDCPTAKQEANKTKSTTDEEVEVISPPTGKTTASVIQPNNSETIVTQESFLKSNTFIIGVITAEVVAVIVGIVLVVSLFRRK